MSKIGIDIADTIYRCLALFNKTAKQFNLEHSNNKPSEEKHLYLPEDIYGWSKRGKKRNFGSVMDKK